MSETFPAPAATGPSLGEIDAKLEMLTDLFRRRLQDDRTKTQALQLLEQQSGEAAAATERRALRPVITGMALVVDRLDRYEGSDPEFAGSIRDELLDLLWRLGFTSIDSADEGFDPSRHEIVGVVPSGSPDGVPRVVRRGFVHEDGRVLRPAQVEVPGS
jgi:molecular chaperone GrpE (heat shock protein)